MYKFIAGSIFLFISISLFGQSNLIDKIDPLLLHQLEHEAIAPCIIIMKEQADVSPAKTLLNKKEKGKYVYKQLKQLARSSQQEVISILQTKGLEYKPFYIINGIATKVDTPTLLELVKREDIARIDADPKIQFSNPRPSSPIGLRNVEWGISQINADDVWIMGYDGTGVLVGGQDTGVEWDHPAIKNQYLGWNGTTANHNYAWHDAIHTAPGNPCGTDTAAPCDDHNHGTHTIGTVVGDDGNGNQIGVAPGAKWMACRNMDEGDGTPSTYIECFEWFLAPTDINGNNADATQSPHVINNSWGCPTSEGCNTGNFATLEAAMNNLIAAGTVVIVSAGNEGSACSTVESPPAIYGSSYAVAALTDSNNAATFSSRGPVTVDGSNRMKPDISAPGVGIRSCIRGGGYASWQGTSMAGPHVVGTVALMMDANPSLKGDPSTVLNILDQTAVGLTTPQMCGGVSGINVPNNTFGRGLVDAQAAVIAALALPVTLVHFDGKQIENYALLSWTISESIHFAAFSIERSKDLVNWETIGKINTETPNSNTETSFQFKDISPIQGVNYYRLAMEDLDGSIEFSKAILLIFNDPSSNNTLSVYPNPSDGSFAIDIPAINREMKINIFDYTGQMILTKSVFASPFEQSIHIDEVFDTGLFFIIGTNTTNNQIFTAKLNIYK